MFEVSYFFMLISKYGSWLLATYIFLKYNTYIIKFFALINLLKENDLYYLVYLFAKKVFINY